MTPGQSRGPYGPHELSRHVRVLSGVVVALVALVAADAGGIAALPGRTGPAGWVRDTATAVEVTVALAGLVVLAAIIALVARRPRRRRDEPPRVVILPTTSRLTQVLVLLVAIALIVAPFVLLFATPHHAAGTGRPPSVTTPATPTTTAPTGHRRASRGSGHGGRDAALLAFAAVVAAAGAGALALGRRRGDRAREQDVRHDAASEDEVRADVAAAATAASAALDRIDSDPRAAVIAAYSAMTRALTGADPQLRAGDTPRRLLERAVAAGIVDPQPARTLITHFEHARFSTHPVTALHVDAARTALEQVQASLTVRAVHR